MKRRLLKILTVTVLLFCHICNFGQTINLGTTANFVLFTSSGAVTNTGVSHLKGNVGTNSGASTGFGNIDGTIHDGNASSAVAASDLLSAYNQLNAKTPTANIATTLGNGQTLDSGVYAISGATTLNQILTLDAQGNANAVFIFQIQGAFSANAASQVILMNGAKSSNVFLEGRRSCKHRCRNYNERNYCC
jgi:hypothetical protein